MMSGFGRISADTKTRHLLAHHSANIHKRGLEEPSVKNSTLSVRT